MPGAFMDSSVIVAGLKGLADAPVNKYLSYLGERVVAAASNRTGVVAANAVVLPNSERKRTQSIYSRESGCINWNGWRDLAGGT